MSLETVFTTVSLYVYIVFAIYILFSFFFLRQTDYRIFVFIKKFKGRIKRTKCPHERCFLSTQGDYTSRAVPHQTILSREARAQATPLK